MCMCSLGSDLHRNKNDQPLQFSQLHGTSYYIIDHIKSKKYTAYLEKFTIEQLRSYSFFGWE